MEIQIPASVTFECPDGQYTATVYSVKPKTKISKKGPIELLRIVYQIDERSDNSLITLVGRDFIPSLELGSQLRDFIALWLGDDYIQAHRKNGSFDLDSLRDRKADLVIRNIQNEKFPKPFVSVVAAYPQGTQVNKEVRRLAPALKKAA